MGDIMICSFHSGSGTRRAPVGLAALVLCAALSGAGCRRGADADPEDATTSAEDTTSGASDTVAGEPPARAADWPRVMVVGPGAGPALFLGPDEDAAAIGYAQPGVRVRIETAPVNGRIEGLFAGGLATKAWIPANRLALYAQRRGRVEGTRAYLGPNDLVSVEAVEGANLRVRVRAWLGGDTFLEDMVGTVPADQLADRPVEASAQEGVSPGECFRLPAGEAVPVYERPNTDPIATLPALDPPLSVVVLRQRNGWFGVRAGFGPYVTGYVRGNLTACGGPLPEPAPMIASSTGERPYWMSQESGALHRVAAGTRVRFHGRTVARLRTEGWARELRREESGRVDVFIAVDDHLAIRGLVPGDALTLVEAAADGGEADEELPDELM